MINIQHYKKRLLDLEEKLDARTSRDLEDGRGELLDTAHDASDASVSDVAVDSEFTEGKAAVGSSYGAAGSLVVVLLWAYWSAQIFFFGLEFTHVYAARRS